MRSWVIPIIQGVLIGILAGALGMGICQWEFWAFVIVGNTLAVIWIRPKIAEWTGWDI